MKREVLRLLEKLGLGKVSRGKKISPERQLHYLNGLRVPLEFFNKPTAKLALRDIENFEKALSSGQLCNKSTGKLYAHNTQVERHKFLKVFLRWRLGAAKALSINLDRLAGYASTAQDARVPETEQLSSEKRESPTSTMPSELCPLNFAIEQADAAAVGSALATADGQEPQCTLCDSVGGSD